MCSRKTRRNSVRRSNLCSGKVYQRHLIHNCLVSLQCRPAHSFLGSDSTKRDICESAGRQPLLCSRRTVKLFLDERYDWYFDTKHVKTAFTDENGQSTTFTGEEELVVDGPAGKPTQARFTYEEAPYFEAIFAYHQNSYASAKGPGSWCDQDFMYLTARLLIDLFDSSC
jgi:hypothetical protein